MASLGNPRTWVPYMNRKDCSQGFCSLYCPQWCYIVYPPPPPSEFPEDYHSSTNFSPLVIAIIGILVSAFLLVSYYALISKFCSNRDSTRRESHDANEDMEENHNPSIHEPWHVSTTGLDEALIKSITVCKYKKGDGLVEVTDCSVCLSEFLEDEDVKLLPKCSHAFHVQCIDKWLKSHSNCPLCRASLFTFNPSAVQVPASVIEIPSRNSEAFQEIQDNNENAIIGRENELSLVEEEDEEERARNREVGKPSFRAFSDLGNLQERRRIFEIRDEGYESIRRSISMDHSFQRQSSVSHVLNINEECSNTEAGPSKRYRGESSSSSKYGYKRKVLHCVMSPISMKRSFSSGRLSLSTYGRGRLGITIPV